MNAEVTEVLVFVGFVKASSAGFDLILNEQIGCINATQFCNAKGKNLDLYEKSKPKIKLKLALSSYYGELRRIVEPKPNYDPCLAGTYFHPALFLDLAAWLGPETYVQSAALISSFFYRNDQRKKLLYKLFVCPETATYENVPPNRLILYRRIRLEVNDRAWFKTWDFRCGYGRKVTNFEKLKEGFSLVEHFRRRGLYSPTYYHPLLFLRFAGWVDVDLYVKCARIVFCCGEVGLNGLLRREIEAAGASSVVSAATPVACDQLKLGRAQRFSGPMKNANLKGPSKPPTTPVKSAATSVACDQLKLGYAQRFSGPTKNANLEGPGPSKPPSTPKKVGKMAPMGPKISGPARSDGGKLYSEHAPDHAAPMACDQLSPAACDQWSSVAPNQSTANRGAQLVKISTSVLMNLPLPRQTYPNLDFSRIILNDHDTNDSTVSTDTSSSTMDPDQPNSEEATMMTRKQHEVEVARVSRKFETELERERLKTETALAEKKEKEVALARVQAEKQAAEARERAKDEQLEALTRRLEDLEIDEHRMTLRKRKHAESRVAAATTLMNEVGVSGLECLVLVLSPENFVYSYRRQFKNIIPTIHKQLHRVVAFIGWFVTTNAVLDYNRCKSLVSDRARQGGHNVRLLQNRMELEDEEGTTFVLGDVVRSILSVDLEVIEADVTILRKLFRKPTHHGDNADSAAEQNVASSSAFLVKVHKWVEDEHLKFMKTVEKRQVKKRKENGHR